jgi:hypothetical protein
MRYRVLTSGGLEAAREALKERKAIPDLSLHEAVVGVGDSLEESVLKGLAQRIRKQQEQLSKSNAPTEELDRLCFDSVHASIPADELLCADVQFWTRFAVVHLADVIYKRFPGRKGKTNLDNFGLGSRRECWPYKLWVRGYLAFDKDAKDPYALGRVGGVDFWTSHVHRQNFMAVPQVFRAVVRLQYPPRLKGKPFLFDGEENPDKGGHPGIRTLIKRLRENWATVEYLLLDEPAVDDLLALHGEGLRKPDGTAAKIS